MNAIVIALTATLNSKVLDSFNKNIDNALASTDVLGEKKGKSSIRSARYSAGNERATSMSRRKPANRKAAVAHTMTELNKLNELLGG